MAASINRVVVVGNLTRDPELRHTPTGTPVCSLRIAVNTRRKDASGQWADKPNYFDVTVFGPAGGELRPVPREGPARGDRRPPRVARVGGQDGNKRQAVEIVADSVQFLGSRGDGDGRRRRRLHPRRRAARRPPATSPRPRPTTTSRSRRPRDMAAEDATAQAAGLQRRPGAPQELPLLQGQGARGGLQERQPAPALHLGEGQDPQPPHHRRVPPPPAPGRGGGQAGPRDGAPALRGRGRDGGHPAPATSRSSA